MSVTSRVIALSLITTVLVGGPLAPLARAQPPAAPPGDLFQESLKASTGETSERSFGPYDAGAAVANILYIPGKVALCFLGIGVGMAILALTFGSGYRTAASMGEEGCGGKWVLRGKDLQPAEPAARAFDWEQGPGR
jgi:hypothetical protein